MRPGSRRGRRYGSFPILERDPRREILRLRGRDLRHGGLGAQRDTAGGGRQNPISRCGRRGSMVSSGEAGGSLLRVMRRRGRGSRWRQMLPTTQHAASTQRPPGHCL